MRTPYSSCRTPSSCRIVNSKNCKSLRPAGDERSLAIATGGLLIARQLQGLGTAESRLASELTTARFRRRPNVDGCGVPLMSSMEPGRFSGLTMAQRIHRFGWRRPRRENLTYLRSRPPSRIVASTTASWDFPAGRTIFARHRGG
jgi:hypothetical protein